MSVLFTSSWLLSSRDVVKPRGKLPACRAHAFKNRRWEAIQDEKPAVNSNEKPCQIALNDANSLQIV